MCTWPVPASSILQGQLSMYQKGIYKLFSTYFLSGDYIYIELIWSIILIIQLSFCSSKFTNLTVVRHRQGLSIQLSVILETANV